MPYELVQGNTWPPIEAYLEDENGPVPLLGAAITFIAKQSDGSKLIQGAGEAIDAANPRARPNVRYVLRADGTDTDTAGVYRAAWDVTFAPGTPDERKETFPSDEWEDLVIRSKLA